MDRLAIGLIKTSHGIKGFFKIKSLSGESEHFFRLKRIYIRKNDCFLSFIVEAVRKISSDILIKLEGIDTPEKAAVYRGLEIWVDGEYAAPLKDAEYYISDICKCRVYRGKEEMGRVKSVCHGGYRDILEIISPCEEIYMVPFGEPFIGDVNIEERRIFLDERFEIP